MPQQQRPVRWEVGRFFRSPQREGLEEAEITEEGELAILAHVYNPTGSKQGHANGNLIAAAPELLEALKQLLFASEHADETGYVTDAGFVDLEAIQQKSHAAIAKAEGRSE